MTCIRLISANTETAKRTIKLTKFSPKIGMCSNVIIKEIKGYDSDSGYKRQGEEGNQAYARARQ